MTDHKLYETGDLDAPDCIKDGNGEVVLGLCKMCGRAERELVEPCDWRYTFPGIPLTEKEKELLIILQEECAEVIQAAAKLLRFGKEQYEDYGDNNTVLGQEIGDLQEMVVLVKEAGLIQVDDIFTGRRRKQEKLAKFQRYYNE